MSVYVETKYAGRALVRDRKGGRCLGRLTRQPNGWEAWRVHRDRVDEFVGWGARRRDAAALFEGQRRR